MSRGILKKIILLILLVFMFNINTKALVLSENDIELAPGDNKDISISIDTKEKLKEVEFTLVFDSYDVPVTFSTDKYKDNNPNGPKHKIVFDNELTGNIELGIININVKDNTNIKLGQAHLNNAKGFTKDKKEIILNNRNINVRIEEVKKEEPKPSNYLKEIKSKIVNINLSDNVYDYEVNIDSNIKELDLEPVLIDNKYKANISSQVINNLDNNIISIDILNNDKTIKTYNIKVNVEEDIVEEKEEVEIINKDIKPVKYKNKWITPIILFSISLIIGIILYTKNK